MSVPRPPALLGSSLGGAEWWALGSGLHSLGFKCMWGLISSSSSSFTVNLFGPRNVYKCDLRSKP